MSIQHLLQLKVFQLLHLISDVPPAYRLDVLVVCQRGIRCFAHWCHVELLLLFLYILNKLQGVWHQVRRRSWSQLPNFNHFDIRFVYKLVVRDDGNLTFLEGVCHDQQFVSTCSQSECDVLGILGWGTSQCLLCFAYQRVGWGETFVAVEVVVEEVASIQSLFHGFIGSITPIEAIIHVTRPRGILLCLYRIKICVFLLQVGASFVEIPVVGAETEHAQFQVKSEGLCICGHYF